MRPMANASFLPPTGREVRMWWLLLLVGCGSDGVDPASAPDVWSELLDRVRRAPRLQRVLPSGDLRVLEGTEVQLFARWKDDVGPSVDVTWTSDRIGPLYTAHVLGATGAVTYRTTWLPVGEHRVTVRVTDPEGRSDAQTRTITVVAAPAWDGDGDGYARADDCDDTRANIHPGALDLCNGVDEDCSGDETDAWWGGDATSGGVPEARLGVEVDAPVTSLQAPVAFDLSLPDLASRAGFADVDPASLRLVPAGCFTVAPTVVPSQHVDGLRSLFAKEDHRDPVGDGAGAFVFLHDLDGDLLTPEALEAGTTARYWLYFDDVDGASRSLPDFASDLVTSSTTLANSRFSASFDPLRGGLMSALTVDGGPSLASLADSCCGNGMFSLQDAQGWMTPRVPVTPEVVADGPILGAFYTEGAVTRLDPAGVAVSGYQFEHLTFAFAGRPELWMSMWQQTTQDSVNAHLDDAALGFRPWESLHAKFSRENRTYHVDPANLWGAFDGADSGVAVGYFAPPTFVLPVGAPPLRLDGTPFTQYFYLAGNDVVDLGAGTPITVPSGTTTFDHVGVVARPYAGGFAGSQDAFLATLAGVTSRTSSVERR